LLAAVPALLTSATFVIAASPANAAEPTVLYVDNSRLCSDTSTGSQELPFCTIQEAADTVQPGQTVAVTGTAFPGFAVGHSGTPEAPITFIGNPQPDLTPGATKLSVSGDVLFDFAHDVKFVNFSLNNLTGPTSAQFTDSQRVTMDRVSIGNSTGPGTGVDIDGDSSDVTISRSQISSPRSGSAIRVDPGASRITLTTNAIQGLTGDAISLNGVTDAAVTSNTVYSSVCGNGIAIGGNSTVVVENNEVGIITASTCTTPGADLSVDADSVDGVHDDYNAYIATSNSSIRYDWGGTTYSTSAAFHAGIGQGQHDLNGGLSLLLTIPAEYSPLIDSADANAPGELATDIVGKPRVDDPLVANTGVGSPPPDRGALDRQDTVSLFGRITLTPGSGQASLTANYTLGAGSASYWNEPVTVIVNFGDGAADVTALPSEVIPHTYAKAGTYTVTTTATDADGNRVVDTRTVNVAAPPPSVSSLTDSPVGFYNPNGYDVGVGVPELYTIAGGDLYRRMFLPAEGFVDWVDLGGGTLTGQPVVYSNPSDDSTDVFVNSGGHLVEISRVKNTWSAWTDLGSGIDGQPAVFHNPKLDTTEVYVRSGTHIMYKYLSGGVWSGWNDLGGNVSGDPAVIYNQHYGTTEVYARSGITAVYKYYAGTSWSGWNSLDGNLSGDPTVFYDAKTSRTEVYARSGSQLWSRYYSGTAWSGWNNLGGNVSGDPAVLYNQQYGTTEVYERSGTDVEYAYSFGGASFSGWTNLGGNTTSDPTVDYYIDGGETQVFINVDGHPKWIYYAVQSGAWSGWEDLTQ
jgi:hypothetical protein